MNSRSRNIPMVAVITRTKGRELLLERALKSVDSQTYDDYVHVIWNDGGDKRVVDSLLKKYPNMRRVVFHNKETEGITKALNCAIRAVDSKYVTILDDDDSWPVERLELTIPYLESTKEKAVVVKMDVVVEEIRGNEIFTISQYLYPESGEGEISLFKQCHKNYISNGSVTYLREVFDQLGGYDESLGVGEDWDFGIRLLLKHDVAFLRKEKPLLFYHHRPRQTGDYGNSVHAGADQLEKMITMLRNRYLRQDINSGRFGVGYIMNNLEHDDIAVVRLERHINNNTDRVLERFSDVAITSITQRFKRRLNKGK